MNKKEYAERLKRVYDRVKRNGILIKTVDKWHYYYEPETLTYYRLDDDGMIEETSRFMDA